MEGNPSLMDDIEDEEIIDFDLGREDIHDGSTEDVHKIKKDFFTNDGFFIIIYEEDEDIIDKLLTVHEVIEGDTRVHLKDENDNDEFLFFDMDDTLVMKNTFYSILEVEKVEIFSDDIDEVELLVTKDIYPEIEIEMEEMKDKIYSIQEKRESILTELISVFKAYGNDVLIFQIVDIVDTLIRMYTLYDGISIDNSDTLEFVKNMMNQKEFELPKWILPIIDNKKRLYKEEGEGGEEGEEGEEDIISISFKSELIDRYNLLDSLEDNNYKKVMNIIYSYSPFQNKDTVLIPYDGLYLRPCSEDTPCNGIKGLLSSDINKTKKELSISVLKDHNTYFETIISKEQLPLHGFYALSHLFLDITMKSKHLSLHELYFLSDYKYSYVLLKDRLKDIVSHIIHNESINEGEDLKENIHSYILNNKDITLEELSHILKNNLPGYTSILNSIPKRIINMIYNYTDLKKAYLCYDIDYHTLDLKNRVWINELIKENIKRYIHNYNQSVKRRIIKPIKKKKTILSTKEKINLSRSFIMGISVIPVRNNYLRMFIQRFSREPLSGENSNYYYEKDSPDKLICKHYLYEINSHKDLEAHQNLISIYGEEVSDGMITCKICKNYICHEKFSLLEGFSGGIPKSTNEELDQSNEELKLLTEKQTKIKKRIHKITALFGIELNHYDKQQIIDYYDLFNTESFIDERYGMVKSFEKHPRYIEIKNSFKFVKPARLPKDKMNNKKNKELMKKELSSLKDYFLDCNEIFIDIFFILFFIQTSIPPYPINSKISIHLWEFQENDTWSNIQQNPNSRISIKTIETITILLKKIINLNRKDQFWGNIQELLFESTKYDEVTTFTQQFLKISTFILKNSKVRDKLKEYILFKTENKELNYIKESWTTYKPFSDNHIVQKINQTINDELKDIKQYLLKAGPDYLYENISSIRSFSDTQQTPRFKQLKIPFSEIMKNESYERLFNYAIHLHGRAPSIPIINLLIKRFIQTITDKTIEVQLGKIGWSSSLHKLDSIRYSDFKQFFAIELIEYFKEKNKEDSDTIDIYLHVHINNWNAMLLNGHRKRNYSYVEPIIFPDESYEELISTEEDIDEEGKNLNKNFVDELFNRFCIDDNGEINERYNIDSFITNILADPSIEREATCKKVMPKTKENFYRILDFKRNLTKLPFPKKSSFDPSIEIRIKHFIRSNNYLERNADELFPVFRQLSHDRRCCSEQELRVLFNDIFKHNSYLINKIQDFFTRNQELEQSQYERFRSSFGRSIESLSVLLNKFLEDTQKIPHMITQVLQIIGRLSNPITFKNGIYFHDDIPKQWKLSETNKTNLQEFLNKNEFLQHYDIYIPMKEKENIGFYQYQKETNYSLCFQGLFNYIKKYFQKDITTILGNNNTKFLEEYGNIFNRYNLLFLFNLIIEYITNLQDGESTVSSQANLLFSSLEEQERLERKDSINLCTRLSFDLLINILEEFIDVNWIYQTNLLSDQLSRQKEREKQEIINSLESKTADARLVMVHQQRCGLSNYFHSAADSHLSHIKSETYRSQLGDERSEVAKELFSQNEVELSVLEDMGINTSMLQPGIPENEEHERQDEAYVQGDQDREDEGLDDPDNDGDYKEN